MLIVLKLLNVKSVEVYIEWKTPDSWFDIVRSIQSLNLLVRPLQLVHLVLMLSSV